MNFLTWRTDTLNYGANMSENKKDHIFTDTMNRDADALCAARNAIFYINGKYEPAVWLEFADQFNKFMGHARKPFTPITGTNFKL